MDNPWIAALTALVLWWLSTGLILMRVRAADNAGGDGHVWSCLLSLPLLAAGVVGAQQTVAVGSANGAFLAFLSALAVWGWVELAFLSGLITGPNRTPCPATATMGGRFVRGFLTLAWHEAALLAALLLLGYLTWGMANPFAFWTFAVLFLARISAKLNLFLGVPRIHTEFLPRPLAHLPSHFRRAPMTPLLPLSVAVLALATYVWLDRAMQADTPGHVTGNALLAALTLLAAMEHCFMVLPLPDQKLWRWMMPAPKPMPKD